MVEMISHCVQVLKANNIQDLSEDTTGIIVEMISHCVQVLKANNIQASGEERRDAAGIMISC